MDFKATTVAPEGRNKYGNYMSTSNVSRAVAIATYGGNAAGGGEAPTPEPLPDDSFVLFLSKTNETYDVSQFGGVAFEDTIRITGYNNTYKAHTFVGDLDKPITTGTDPETEAEIITGHDKWDIECTDEKVKVIVNDNGTEDTSIKLQFPEGYIPLTGGKLRIPVNIYLGKNLNPEDGHYEEIGLWYSLKTDCVSMWFTFEWTITSNASTSEGYTIDLSNQLAEINATNSGDIYPNAKRPDDCDIKLFKGIELMTAATCNIQAIGGTAMGWSYSKNEGGYTTIHFNQVGDRTPFNFEGEAISFRIEVYLDSTLVGTRFMQISKNKAGTDGSSPTTRWIVTSPNEITIDKSDDKNWVFNTTAVTATIYRQVGENDPEIATGDGGYWWNESETVGKHTFTTFATVPVDTTGPKAVTFGLLRKGGTKTLIDDYYELEDVPIITGGKGNTGNDGIDGNDGEDGQSVYTLYLTNDSTSVNCDAEGNVYASSKALLECEATLYYGASKVSPKSVTDIMWTVQTDAGTNIPYDMTDGGATISLNFDSYTFPKDVKGIGVYITAEYSGETFEKVMSIAKNYPGPDGKSPTSYFLTIYPNVITCEKTKNQSGNIIYTPDFETISVQAKKQVGDGPIQGLSNNEGTIYYNWHRRSGDIDTGGSASTGSLDIDINSAKCLTYNSINVWLKIGSEIVDNQMVPILANGLDGNDGLQGRTGAAVRGPIEWTDGEMGHRVFCDGKEYTGNNTTIKEAHPELWIDIVLRREGENDVYYRCIEAFENLASYTWNNVKSHFEAADAQYKFVATDLLLAKNAKINFLTGNEIYLTNTNNEVNAGLAGGGGINFWAGSSTPGDAPFQVNNDGEVTAKKGTFGPWELSQDGGLTRTAAHNESTYGVRGMSISQEGNYGAHSKFVVDTSDKQPVLTIQSFSHLNNYHTAIQTEGGLIYQNGEFCITNSNDQSSLALEEPRNGVVHIKTLTKREYEQEYIDGNTLYIIIDDVY